MRDRAGAIGTAGIVLLIVAGCAPGAEPGTPEQAAATVPEPVAAQSDISDAGAASDSPSETDDGAEPVLLGGTAEPRPVPILPAGLSWSPAEPEEGSAFGIRILQPAAGQ
ncbi:MAG: hypothetical protein ABFS14_12375, partial [Gemmatimonadota bacterium]